MNREKFKKYISVISKFVCFVFSVYFSVQTSSTVLHCQKKQVYRWQHIKKICTTAEHNTSGLQTEELYTIKVQSGLLDAVTWGHEASPALHPNTLLRLQLFFF